MSGIKPQKAKYEELTTAQIHVSYISKQVIVLKFLYLPFKMTLFFFLGKVDVLISEATLRGIFELFGTVVDVAIKKSQFDKVRI